MLPDTAAEAGDFISTRDLEPDRQQVMFLLYVFGDSRVSQMIKLQILKSSFPLFLLLHHKQASGSSSGGRAQAKVLAVEDEVSCSKSTTKEYVSSLKFGVASWFQIIKVKISIRAIQFGHCLCVNVIRKSHLDTGEQVFS